MNRRPANIAGIQASPIGCADMQRIVQLAEQVALKRLGRVRLNTHHRHLDRRIPALLLTRRGVGVRDEALPDQVAQRLLTFLDRVHPLRVGREVLLGAGFRPFWFGW